MRYNLDDVIEFSKRHPNETIRQIIRYDSGYLKDLFIKDERVVFSEDCFKELCRLTQGHKDNWEDPKEAVGFFPSLKFYKSPYLYDFNDPKLLALNEKRLECIREPF